MTALQHNGELHFFVIWEYGRSQEQEILADIGKHFEILECFDILWSPRRAINNFCRLYDSGWWIGRKLAKKCGTGRFLLITVWDNSPVYEVVKTTPYGFERANTNTFKLAKRFCDKGNHKNVNLFHASIRPEEVNRFLTLILGKNSADYLDSVKTPWDDSIVKMDRDILGADGWNSLEEVFYALNNTVNYVVLRDFEKLPYNFDPNTHKDIDVLTDEPEQLLCILNPPKSFFCSPRGEVKIKVGDRQILWDIRHVGDGYYCTQWEQDMLRDKVFNVKNVYVLNDEHFFYSLMYHALVRGKTVLSIEQDYRPVLESLLQQGIIQTRSDEQAMFPGIFDFFFDILTQYMKREKYVFCRPQRAQYNQTITCLSQNADYLKKQFGLCHVKPIRVTFVAQKNCGLKKRRRGRRLENYDTYYQAWLDNRKIFIKFGGYEGTRRREFEYTNRLNGINENNFYEVFFYNESEHCRCIASEYFTGKSFYTVEGTGVSPSEKDSLVSQIKNIAQSLAESGIVHGDVHPDNLIITEEGKLRLIDFEVAVDSRRYGAWSAFPLRRDSFLLRHLCVKCTGRWKCCDVFALQKTLESIGCQESYQETYRDAEAFLLECPIIIVRCMYWHFFSLKLVQLDKFLSRFRFYHFLKDAIERFW